MVADGQERVAGMESRLWQMLMKEPLYPAAVVLRALRAPRLWSLEKGPQGSRLFGAFCVTLHSQTALRIRCGQSRTVFQIAFIVGSLEVLMTKILS